MREPFRHHSYAPSTVDTVIAKLGVDGQQLAVETICQRLDD
jgi:3-dehydroquinate dehydratase